MAHISRRAKLNLTVFISIAVISAGIALFVMFIMPKMATVKFVDAKNVSTEIADSILVEKGTALPSELPRPTKYGYSFVDWYHSDEVNENVRVNPGVDIIEDDTTLYGHFLANEYTVTYNLNGGLGNSIPSKTATYGTIFKVPTELNAGIYMPDKVLWGWCEDPDGHAVLIKPGKEIEMFGKDTTLYAIWGNPQTTVYYVGGLGTEYLYHKTFDSNGVIPDEDDNRIDAYRYGYVFDGWYTDETYTTKIDFDTFILRGSEVWIYAKFTPKQYTVTYKVFNDTTQMWEVWNFNGQDQIFDTYFGGTIDEPTVEPSKIGSVFVCWCVDDSLLAPYRFSNTIDTDPGDRVLYAKFGDIPAVDGETPASAFNYTKDDLTKTVTITGMKDTTLNMLIIPRQIDGYNVTALTNIVGMQQLTEVWLPYTIKTISDETFRDCPRLTTFKMISQSQYFAVNEADGVLYSADFKTLYRYPASRDALTYETASATETIMPFAFNNCRILQNLTLNAVTIKSNAFKDCTSIVNLTFSSNLVTIMEGAFIQCDSLSNVTSNSSQIVVFEGAIYNSTKTRLIKYYNKATNANYVAPSTLTNSDRGAFWGCTNLVSATFLENFKSIGANAFYGCTALTTLEFRALKFNSAGADLIAGCTAIEKIKLNMDSTNPIYGALQQSGGTAIQDKFEQI